MGGGGGGGCGSFARHGGGGALSARCQREDEPLRAEQGRRALGAMSRAWHWAPRFPWFLQKSACPVLGCLAFAAAQGGQFRALKKKAWVAVLSHPLWRHLPWPGRRTGAQKRWASSGDGSCLKALAEAGSALCLARLSPGLSAYHRGQPAGGITEGIVFPQQPVCFPSRDIAGRA